MVQKHRRSSLLTLQFTFNRALSNQVMTQAPPYFDHQSESALAEITIHGLPHKETIAGDTVVSRPSLASRMLQLFLRRKHDPSATKESKSWPGRPEPVPVPKPTILRRQASANIIIPSDLSTSAPSAFPATKRTRTWRICEQTTDCGCCDENDWRRLQTYCANCERLFFTSLSGLDENAGRFCSLDCKTNYEYMHHLHEVMDVHMSGLFSTSSVDLSFDSEEDDDSNYEGAEQIWQTYDICS